MRTPAWVESFLTAQGLIKERIVVGHQLFGTVGRSVCMNSSYMPFTVCNLVISSD